MMKDTGPTEQGASDTRAGAPKVQPVLAGLAIAAIIAAIAVAAFWTQL